MGGPPPEKRTRMKYSLFVIASGHEPATPGEMRAIDAFNDALEANGQWILAAGIVGPADAVVIDNRAGAGIVSPGPIHVAPEHIAGFWIVEVADHETALRLATEGSLACNRRVEVRAFLR
ncbi:MAG: YciI family protein [Armatimonadota bacterium]